MKTSASFLINVASRIVITIVSILAGFFLSRYLGPEKYGILAVYTTLLGFIPSLLNLGVIDSLAVNISKDGLSNKLYSNGLILVTFISVAFVVLLLVFRTTIYQVLSLDFDNYIYILLTIHIFFYFVNAYHEKMLEAIAKSHVFSAAQIVLVIARTISILLIIFSKQSLIYVLLLEFIITVFFVIIYWTYSIRTLKLRFEFALPTKAWVVSLMKYGTSVYLAGLFFLFSQQLPILVTQALYGAESVSYINIPLNFISRLFLPVLALASVISPLFGKKGIAEAIDDRKYSDYLDYSLKLLFIIYVPIMIVFISQSSQIITMLYGEAYFPAGAVLGGLAVFVLFSAINTFIGTVLQYLGLAKKRLRNILFAFFVTLVMFVASIQLLGFNSIAYAMSASIVFLTLLDLRLLSSSVNIYWTAIFKYLAVALVSSLPLYLLTFQIATTDHVKFLIMGSLGGLIYVIVILVFKMISKDDLKLIFSSARDIKSNKVLKKNS